MRVHTYLSLPGLEGWAVGSINNAIQRIERAQWAAEDALEEWRNHAHDLEAREQAWQVREHELVARINALQEYVGRLEAAERSLRASNARMVPEGKRLEQRERDLVAHIDGKLLPHIKAVEDRERDQKARIERLVAREVELVEKCNGFAKRINEDFIPEVARLLEVEKKAAVEAARAAEREKALEARNAALAEENERLRAELAAARHDLADADEAGRVLRDEVDSLEREAHERQQEGTPALASGP